MYPKAQLLIASISLIADLATPHLFLGGEEQQYSQIHPSLDIKASSLSSHHTSLATTLWDSYPVGEAINIDHASK